MLGAMLEAAKAENGLLLRALQGDLSALRWMRDYWVQLAIGECVNPHFPKEELLPQTQLLAELLAASGQAEDQVALLVVYQLRHAALGHNRDASEDCVKRAVEANDIPGLNYWSGAVADLGLRQSLYRAKMDALINTLISERESADGAAMLVTALSIQADSGDERAPGLLQTIMDSVTPERASAIQAQVRKLEAIQ